MLTAKRILVVIAIVLCFMQILDLFVQMIRPKKEAQESPLRQVRQMLDVTESETARRTLVWYVGGLVALVAAAAFSKGQPWLQLSFGIGGFSAMLIGCSGGALMGIGGIYALLIGGAGGAFGSAEFLGPRFGLSLLTLAILVTVSGRLSRDAGQPGTAPPSTP